MPKSRRTREVFISWSGKRSLAVAESLCDFIPRVIPELKDRLFVSTGIEKGARWSDEIARRLEEADAGILCLTAEGLNSSWLHFEAGALTKGLDSTRARRGEAGGASSSSRIFTYLHGIAPTAFSGPLSQYQWTAANRDDTWRLMHALHHLFATARSEMRLARRRFDERWPELERELRRNAVLVADIVPEFESWFQRKTFVESLDESTDRSWIARYDDARDTHAMLTHRADHVRIGCTDYQRQLYHELIAMTDVYVAGLRPLIRALPDDDSAPLRAAVAPDVASACERQRARTNTIVQLILHPVAIPFADDAVAFAVTDSAEQRRLLAQRYEDSVREIADRRLTLEHRGTPHGDAPSTDHPTTGSLGLDTQLATAEATRKLFRSLWALDRIAGYVAWEHLYADTSGAAGLLLQRATSELETLQSQEIDANPLPLQYALQALAAALRMREARHAEDVPPIRALCGRIEEAIHASRTSDGEPTIDRGKQLRAALASIRKALDALPADTPSLPASLNLTPVPDPLEDA
jgi:hypothetical protein